MPYLVCHMEKYQRQDVSPVEAENERDETYKASNRQIDPSRTHRNYHLKKPQGSYIEMINGRIATLNLKRKIRSDAVYMNSFVLGSDAKFFEGLTEWQCKEFFWDCFDFFSEKFGYENILSAVVHMDETNPHLHLNLVPITNGKLCSKDLYDRKKLSQLQTEFWEKVGRKWGLQRGEEGSGAKHLSTAEYKAKKIMEAAEKQATETTENAEREASKYLAGIHEQVGGEADKPTPRKRKDAEQEIKDLRTDNAAYRIEQERAYKEIHSLFEQWRAADKRSKENESAREVLLEMSRAYPDEFKELLDRSRQKLNPAAFYTPTKSNHSGKDGK